MKNVGRPFSGLLLCYTIRDNYLTFEKGSNMATRWNNPDGTRMKCRRPDCEEDVVTQGMCRKCYNHMYYRSVSNPSRRNQKREFDLGME